MAEFIQSEKDRPILLMDGFLYVKDKQVRSKVYWKCQHFAEKCKGRAITVDGSISSVSGEHNHSGNPTNVEVRKFLDKVKSDARTTRDSPHYIVSNAASELSGCVAAALPQTSSLKRSIRRVRQEEQCRSTVNHRNQLILSEEDTKTNKGKAFLMFDSGEVEDRMLVFSTEKNLNVLASCKHYFMDGTFKTVPVIFDQLYTIHGMKNGYVIPLVYALLPNKREETYSNFLRTVKTIAPTLDVESVNTDFEPAVVKAIKEELPSIPKAL